jgi:hypothetical protein
MRKGDSMSSQSNKLLNAIRSMQPSMKQGINASLIAGTLLLGTASITANSAILTNEIIYVGVWDSTGSGNPTGVGGPGVAAGQKYVIRLSYDDTSIVTNNVAVPDGGGNPTTNLMSTIDLSAPGNSLDIYVPMTGLDTGSPFIYTQDETNHFDFGINSPVPTLNFINGSFIGDKANIIGIEYEGDFVPGAGNNIIQLLNQAPPGGNTSMTARINNLTANIASSDTDLDAGDPAGVDRLAEAVELMVDAGPNIVYNAASLTQTATATITQSNNLGAGRADGEDFVDLTWSPEGTVTGNSNEVNIADSGLTMTTSTTTWAANAEEQMTGKTASDTTNVSYENAIPTLNASATANGNNVDFIFDANDIDLAVNSIISGFEMLSFDALVNGVNASSFFVNLFSLGNLSLTMADLFSEFGSGNHSFSFSAMDKVGATATAAFGFDVTGANKPPTSVPEPTTILLMCASLMLLWRKQSKH